MKLPARSRRVPLAATMIATTAVLVGAILFHRFFFRPTKTSVVLGTGRGATIPKIVDVPFALIGDFYEHFEEHAPPYAADGEMQRRERYYTPPQNPFDLIRSALQSNSKPTGSDLALSDLFADLEKQWAQGLALSSKEYASLEQFATASSLHPTVLLEAGRSLNFLVGDAAAAALFRAALTKAIQHYKNAPAGDPAALDLLHLLDQTKALHRLKDYPALIQRFELAMRLYPPQSVEARRSACLYADALSRAGQTEAAATAILDVWRQDLQAGDLSLGDRRGLPEMEWRAAWYLADAERWEEAIPFCSDFAMRNTDPSRRRRILRLWISCLVHQGKHEEVLALENKYQLTRHPQTAPSTAPAQAG